MESNVINYKALEKKEKIKVEKGILLIPFFGISDPTRFRRLQLAKS